jgi:hypothetical protein
LLCDFVRRTKVLRELTLTGGECDPDGRFFSPVFDAVRLNTSIVNLVIYSTEMHRDTVISAAACIQETHSLFGIHLNSEHMEVQPLLEAFKKNKSICRFEICIHDASARPFCERRILDEIIRSKRHILLFEVPGMEELWEAASSNSEVWKGFDQNVFLTYCPMMINTAEKRNLGISERLKNDLPWLLRVSRILATSLLKYHASPIVPNEIILLIITKFVCADLPVCNDELNSISWTLLDRRTIPLIRPFTRIKVKFCLPLLYHVCKRVHQDLS